MRKHILYPKLAGIYKLTCIDNGKIYIGKSVNIRNRLSTYKGQAKQSKSNWYFGKALIKYGWNSFTVEILEIFEPFDKLKDNHALLDREAYYIELYDATNTKIGYNICKYSNDGTGIPSRPITEEHRANLRKARALQVRGPLTEEQKQKMRGRVCSEETKEKIRNTKKGTTLSEEHKEKIRQSCMGNTHTEESIEKMRQAKRGGKHSEEAKQKMRNSRLLYLENKKIKKYEKRI